MKAEELGEKAYVNPRNAAAGSIRQKNSSVAAKRNLSFWAYQIGLISGGPHLKSHFGTLEYLSSLGFPVNQNAQRTYFKTMVVTTNDRTLKSNTT